MCSYYVTEDSYYEEYREDNDRLQAKLDILEECFDELFSIMYGNDPYSSIRVGFNVETILGVFNRKLGDEKLAIQPKSKNQVWDLEFKSCVNQ